jgi:hypothetical protein
MASVIGVDIVLNIVFFRIGLQLLILCILMMEEIRSSETSVLTRLTMRHIPADGILHSHCSENLKFYILFRYIP